MNIFLVAGEVSGDVLGAQLIRAIKKQRPDTSFAGVGGDLMASAGMEMRLHLSSLSVMGIWEVLGELRRLRDIVVTLCRDIEENQPEVVVTVDFPDFNFYLGKQLKKRGLYKGKIVHYVAPTVWAWRPGRARKVSKFLDGLICLFPFEPAYFTKHGLDAVYCGHPVIEEKLKPGAGEAFRKLHGIKADTKTLGLFFGSREKELANLGEILKEAAMMTAEQVKPMALIVPTLPQLEYEVLKLTEDMSIPAYVTADPAKKWAAMQACDAAAAVSGTVGLELAYAGVPHIIAYKMSPLTWLIVKLLVKTKYAHLANIMLKKTVVPELLQTKCNSGNIRTALVKLFKQPKAAEFQKRAFAKIGTMLGENPSEKAAAFVLKIAGKP